MSRVRALADAYAEAMLDGMPERWRRMMLNAAAVVGVVAALLSLNAMGALLADEKAFEPDESLLFADGALVVPKSLPASGDTADRARRGTRGGAQDADRTAASGEEAAPSENVVDISRDVARLVDREATPGRPSRPGPAGPPDTVNSVVPLTLPGPEAVVPISGVDAAPAASEAPGVAPAPVRPAPAARGPMRLELRSLERITGRNDDRLEVTLAALHGDENTEEHLMSMRVDLPDADRGNRGESLRLQFAVLAPQAGDAAPAPDSLRVRVSLSDTTVDEPTVSRTDPTEDSASDTLHLLIPLDPPVGATPAPPAEPPAETPAPPATDTTVPVDVVVPVTQDAAPPPQTVDLPPALPDSSGAPAPQVTVGVTPAPPAPPAPADPPADPAPAPPAG
jgi:hypothetical protein